MLLSQLISAGAFGAYDNILAYSKAPRFGKDNFINIVISTRLIGVRLKRKSVISTPYISRHSGLLAM